MNHDKEVTAVFNDYLLAGGEMYQAARNTLRPKEGLEYPEIKVVYDHVHTFGHR